MTYELLRCLVALTISSSTAVLIILVIRRPVRHAFGAAAAYFSWLWVPVAVAATFLPRAIGAEEAAPVSWVSSISRLSLVLDRSLESSLSAQSSINWPAWLLLTWGAGAVLFLLYLVVLQRAFLRSLGALSGSSRVLRAESSAGCPALVGVFRPKLILPADFELRYTPQERSLILVHERVHLLRGDAFWNALVALLSCLFWFNPLIHFAAGRLRVDQELACDAAVINRYPVSRRVYAGAMLKTLLADAALPIGCHWRSIHPLKERLEMLKESAPGPIRREIGRVFVAIASLAVGYVAWASDPVADPAPLAEPPVAPTEEYRGPIDIRSNKATTTDNGGAVLEGDVVVNFGRTRITADRARVSAQTPLTRSAEWVFEGNVIAASDGREWFRGEALKLKLSPGHMNLESSVGADQAIAPYFLRERPAERSR